MPAGILDLRFDLMPGSPVGDILTVRNVVVQPVKPPKSASGKSSKPVGGTDRKSKTTIGAAR